MKPRSIMLLALTAGSLLAASCEKPGKGGPSSDQVEQKNSALPSRFELLSEDPGRNFFDVRKEFLAWWEGLDSTARKANAREMKQFSRWQAFWWPRVSGSDLKGSFVKREEIIQKALLEREATLQQPVSNPYLDANGSLTIQRLIWRPSGPYSIPGTVNGTDLRLHGLGRVVCVQFHPNYDASLPFGTGESPDQMGKNTIYAGTRYGGVWRSTNGGQSWHNPSRTLLPNAGYDIEATHTGTLYAITTFTSNDRSPNQLVKSLDNGLTWTYCTRPYGSSGSLPGQYERISDILIHPDWWYQSNGLRTMAPTPNTYRLLACSSDGVMASTDKGVTWSQSMQAFPANFTSGPRKLTLNPSRKSELFTSGLLDWGGVASGKDCDSIFRSTDFGVSFRHWKTISKFSSTPGPLTLGINPAAATALNAQHLRIGEHKVFASHQNPNKLYVMVTMYYTGPTNTSFSDGGGGAGGGTVTFSSGQWSKNWLLRTTDGGNTWAILMKCVSTFNNMGAMEIDPGNDNVLYYGLVGGSVSSAHTYRLEVMANGTCSTTLQHGSPSQTHADIRAIAMKAVPSGRHMLIGTDGGVTKSSNAGAATNTAHSLPLTNVTNTGMQISEMYAMSTAQTGQELWLAGLQDNGTFVYRPSTGGWKQTVGGDGMDCAISPLDPNLAVSTDGQGCQTIMRYPTLGSLNSGTNACSPEVGNWVFPIAYHPAPIMGTQTGLLRLAAKNLWESSDNGATWTRISHFGASPPMPNAIVSMAQAPSLQHNIAVYGIWQSLGWHGYFHTTDNGLSWLPLRDPSNQLPMWNAATFAYDANDPTSLFIALSGYSANPNGSLQKVYRVAGLGTPGETWVNWSDGLSLADHINSITMDKETRNLYLATDNGVYVRHPNETYWSFYGGGLPMVPITEIQIRYDNDSLRASTFGRGVWSAKKK